MTRPPPTTPPRPPHAGLVRPAERQEWLARCGVAEELPRCLAGVGENPVAAVIPWHRRHALALWIGVWSALGFVFMGGVTDHLALLLLFLICWYGSILLVLGWVGSQRTRTPP